MGCAGWCVLGPSGGCCPMIFPRWEAVYQQTQRWLRAGFFEAMAHDLRLLLRLAAGRKGQPSAVILDARTVQSTPESGAHAGYDGHKRRNGAKVHVAVDTLGHLLATVVTPASEPERAQVADLAEQVQTVTGESGRVGLCRSRLYRHGASRSGRRARDPVGGGQAA